MWSWGMRRVFAAVFRIRTLYQLGIVVAGPVAGPVAGDGSLILGSWVRFSGVGLVLEVCLESGCYVVWDVLVFACILPPLSSMPPCQPTCSWYVPARVCVSSSCVCISFSCMCVPSSCVYVRLLCVFAFCMCPPVVYALVSCVCPPLVCVRVFHVLCAPLLCVLLTLALVSRLRIARVRMVVVLFDVSALGGRSISKVFEELTDGLIWYFLTPTQDVDAIGNMLRGSCFICIESSNLRGSYLDWRGAGTLRRS